MRMRLEFYIYFYNTFSQILNLWNCENVENFGINKIYNKKDYKGNMLKDLRKIDLYSKNKFQVDF